MKKEIKTLDLEFNNDLFGLYVVIDQTTDLEVSPIMQIRNDCVAVDSFHKLLSDPEQKDKKAPYSKYVLKSVGVYDVVEHRIISGEEYDIITDDEDVEQYLNDIVSVLNENEDEE